MRSKLISNKRGATIVEMIMVLTILVIFTLVAVLIMRSGFLSSLLTSSKLNFGNSTVQCSITTKEISSSSSSCTYELTASQGTSGVIYYLFGQGQEQCSYLAGSTNCVKEVTISNYALFKCNTSGDSSSGTQVTSPGGEYTVNVTCGG